MKRHRSPVVLLLVLLGVAGAVWAGPKEEVAAATAQWATRFVDEIGRASCRERV